MRLPFNKLVIASGNTGKIRELEHLLKPLNLEIIPQAALDVPEAEEPYATFIENALAKARHASQHTNLPAIADDSGLCVDALKGAPGVISARYACEDESTPKSDTRNNAKLLKVMADEKNRHAHFYCVIVLVRHANDPEPIIAEGVWTGEILSELKGSDGFGYDPLFMDAKTGKTVAELPLDIKSRISHRGHAMAKLLQKLERLAV
ncbi:MAG: dITP/XTP pyrophosphatase [Pseudomonadota bacterium]